MQHDEVPFAVVILVPFTPDVTIGTFSVTMMLLSTLVTILYLPALITLTQGWLFKEGAKE